MSLRATRALLLGLVLSASTAALAEPEPPPDPAMAQSLFEAGRSLMVEGKLAEACAKFEASNRLDPSAGTLLNLGKCLEGQGRIATAWATYKRAIVVGRAKGQTRHVEAAERFAIEIEPRVSKLEVTPARDVPGLRLFRGEVEILAAARAVPIAVDPGSYEIRAEAPGFETWRRTIEVEPGAAVVRVEVPELTKREAEASPERPVAPPPQASKGPRLDLVIAGSVVSGAGIVCLAVGAGFGAATLSDAASAREDADLCPEGRCTEAGWEHVQAAETKATVSTALLVVGGAAAAAGTALLVLGFVLEPPSADVAVVPILSPGFAGLAFGGRL